MQLTISQHKHFLVCFCGISVHYESIYWLNITKANGYLCEIITHKSRITRQVVVRMSCILEYSIISKEKSADSFCVTKKVSCYTISNKKIIVLHILFVPLSDNSNVFKLISCFLWRQYLFIDFSMQKKYHYKVKLWRVFLNRFCMIVKRRSLPSLIRRIPRMKSCNRNQLFLSKP